MNSNNVLLVLATCLSVSLANDKDEPIVHLTAECPAKSTGHPLLQLTADVPAYAKARCQNGATAFTTLDEVAYLLPSTFDPQDPDLDNCLFYKRNGSNTFVVDVEIGWGEKDSQVLTYTNVKTISCAYDDHGKSLSSEETISDWFLAPRELQTLLGANSTVTFALKTIDVLDQEINTKNISIGRKIRLMATNTSGTLSGFRALSCVAKSPESTYPILRAGCGDGLVFPKTVGFYTEGNVVISPYFDTFKLTGGDKLKFICTFTVCTSGCDGSSCPTERKKRSSAARNGSFPTIELKSQTPKEVASDYHNAQYTKPGWLV